MLDLAPEQELNLFAEDLLARLHALGTVERIGGEGRLGADVLVTGWRTPALPERRAEAGRIGLVVHSAGTIRKIVPKSLIEDGVRVSQATAGMARSVAEFALHLTMSLLRSLHGVDRAMHGAHDWSGASVFGLGTTIAGTRIGVVGASRVGRIYIELVRACGAEVVVHDPFLTEAAAQELGVELAGLDELVRSCQVVALHAPVTDETRGMISAERLAMIPDGGVLVNTARSAVLDGIALERELVSGRLSAALDVFDTEPLPADSPLWGLSNVILTPHIGAVTTHSRRSQGVIVVEEIERWCRGEDLRHEVLATTYDRLA